MLDANGNLTDAIVLSTLAALLVFRRPDVNVTLGEGGEQRVVILPPDEREPVPLSLHHLPVSISFALLEVRCRDLFLWAFCVKFVLLLERPAVASIAGCAPG